MSPAERVENLILGGGAAGKLLAWELARAGRRTAVIERALIGGSCPNIACMPSKNVIHSAKVAQFLRHAAEFGLRAGPATTDMAGVRQRKRAMVEGMVAIHQTRFAANGLEFILGEGRFIAPMTIEVWLAEGGTRRLEAERVFLDVGTHATVPDIPGLAAAAPLTHVEALELDRLPAHLVVLGGGYVGLEMAQAFRRFGSEVTVVERGPQLAAREDPDVAAAIRTIFLEDGIELALDTEPVGVEGSSGEKVRLRVATNDGERVIEGSDLLVAAGRTPNTDGIGLDVAGVELDPRGYVKVDERLETTAPGVWAMGECAGSPQFTHAAVDDFRARQPGGTGPHDPRPADPLLRVHRPRAGSGRLERAGGRAPGDQGAGREAAHERGVASADHRRDAWLHEGADRSAQGGHPRLCDARRRGRGGGGRGADGDAGGAAIYRVARCHPHPPDDGRGPERALRQRLRPGETVRGAGQINRSATIFCRRTGAAEQSALRGQEGAAQR